MVFAGVGRREGGGLGGPFGDDGVRMQGPDYGGPSDDDGGWVQGPGVGGWWQGLGDNGGGWGDCIGSKEVQVPWD